MQEIWRNPAAEFMWTLKRNRVEKFFKDPAFLISMRHDADLFFQYNKLFGEVIDAEFGTSLWEQVCLAQLPEPTKPRTSIPKRKPKMKPAPRCYECLLPPDLQKVLFSFVGETENKQITQPEPIVPEYDLSGHYGSYPSVSIRVV